jgi:hypothetical protein
MTLDGTAAEPLAVTPVEAVPTTGSRCQRSPRRRLGPGQPPDNPSPRVRHRLDDSTTPLVSEVPPWTISHLCRLPAARRARLGSSVQHDPARDRSSSVLSASCWLKRRLRALELTVPRHRLGDTPFTNPPGSAPAPSQVLPSDLVSLPVIHCSLCQGQAAPTSRDPRKRGWPGEQMTDSGG